MQTSSLTSWRHAVLAILLPYLTRHGAISVLKPLRTAFRRIPTPPCGQHDAIARPRTRILRRHPGRKPLALHQPPR